jgi:hypothetical protein
MHLDPVFCPSRTKFPLPWVGKTPVDGSLDIPRLLTVVQSPLGPL